jgi:hypothetical protein
MKNLKKLAEKLDDYGRDGDTLVAHINPREAAMLKAMGGRGTVNPKTGLLEFADSEGQGTSEAGATGAGTDSYGSVGGGYDTGGSPGYDAGYGTVDTFGGQTAADLGNWDGALAGVVGEKAGPSYAESRGIGGRIGDAVGAKLGDALSRPAETAINTVAGMALGPVGLANTVSGWFGGPTIGSLATGAARGLSEGSPQTASAGPDASGNTRGAMASDMSGGASGSGDSPLSRSNSQSPLAQALLGSPPNPSGRMSYGAPWAYRG